jgi:hypothetical protein
MLRPYLAGKYRLTLYRSSCSVRRLTFNRRRESVPRSHPWVTWVNFPMPLLSQAVVYDTQVVPDVFFFPFRNGPAMWFTCMVGAGVIYPLLRT